MEVLKSLLPYWQNIQAWLKQLSEGEIWFYGLGLAALGVIATLVFRLLKRLTGQTGRDESGNNQPSSIIEVSVVNTHGVDLTTIQQAQQSEGLNEAIVTRLLKTIDEKDIALADRNKAFSDLVQKHASLERQLDQYNQSNVAAAQAKNALRDGKIDQAEKILLEAIADQEQQLATYHFETAQISEINLDYPEAIRRYKKALTLNSEHFEGWYALAQLYTKTGNSEGALYAYTELHKISSDANNERRASWAQIGLGDTLALRGQLSEAMIRYEDAATAFRSKLDCDPNNSEWQRDLIVSYVKLSEVFPAQAAKYLRLALNTAQGLMDAGRLYPADHLMIDDLNQRLSDVKD